MADDFQVKQGVNTQSSSGAYGLTGGVIGAAAGGLGAHYITKPKYSSHEDIINEAKDSADFKSKLEKATGEEKNFLQAAKDVADEKANAEKAWNDEFKAYQEAHKEGLIKDDAFKELEKKQAEIQDKVKELETKANDAAPKTTTTTVKKDPLAALRQTVEEADNARKELAELKANKAPKEAIDKVRARISKYDKRFESLIDQVVEASQFKGDEEAVKNAKKALKADLTDYTRAYLETRDKIVKAKPEVNYSITKANIAEEQKVIDNALAKIKELTNRDLTDALVNNKGAVKGVAFDKEVEAVLKVEGRKTKTLEKLLENFPKDAKPEAGINARQFLKEFFKSFINNKPMELNGEAYNPEKAMKDFIETLRPEEKALLEGKEVTKENIEALIKASKERTDAINEAAKSVRTSSSTVATLENTLRKNQEEVVKKYGEGAHINSEGKVCIKGKEIPQEKVKTPQIELPELDAEVKKKLPKEIEIEHKSTAKKAAPSPELVEARKNLEEVNKQIEEARKGLKTGAIDEAQQLADFAKEKGVKDKNEFLNNQVKEKADKFAKDFESQFKRKYGFAEHANWKIAGVAAAGAIILGGLANLMAPKDRA